MATSYIVAPDKSPNIDSYMGDIVKHIAVDVGRALDNAIQTHPQIRGDLATLASAVVHRFATDFGSAGIEALLRTRTLSKFCQIDEDALKAERD